MKRYILGFIVLLLLALSACDKKQKGTFTIKGQLLQDCSGSPVVGRRISVREQVQFGHGADEIGSATTDDNGYFELVASYYSSEPKEVRGLIGEYFTPKIPESRIIDLDTLYSNFFSSVVVKLDIGSTAFQPTDTIFIRGIGLYNEIDTIYPIISGIQYHLYSYNYSVSEYPTGGIRNKENNLTKLICVVGAENLNTSNYSNSYHINYCGQSKDTVTITLP